MSEFLTAKELRATLPSIVSRVRQGARYTVIYRSRPAFQIVPIAESAAVVSAPEQDALYAAPALGRSRPPVLAHDEVLYPDPRPKPRTR